MTARRLLALLPTIAFLATFGVFFVDERRAATSVFRSGRGLTVMAVLVAGYAVVAFGLRRFVRVAWVAPVVLAFLVVGLAAWIVRPYYVDTVADDPAAPAAIGATEPLGTGSFRGLAGHDGAGTASLLDRGDGTLVVRLTGFDIEGVPDPRVHLIEGADQQRAGGVDLGRLEANRGASLDIVVPAGVDAGRGWTVLVWCRAFAVPVANATLS